MKGDLPLVKHNDIKILSNYLSRYCTPPAQLDHVLFINKSKVTIIIKYSTPQLSNTRTSKLKKKTIQTIF